MDFLIPSKTTLEFYDPFENYAQVDKNLKTF